MMGCKVKFAVTARSAGRAGASSPSTSASTPVRAGVRELHPLPVQRPTSDECEAGDSEAERVIILGNGPNRIGQGLEFDYCCCHAAFAVRDARLHQRDGQQQPRDRVSTDYDTSDKLYFEPIDREHVTEPSSPASSPSGVILQFGGQTPTQARRTRSGPSWARNRRRHRPVRGPQRASTPSARTARRQAAQGRHRQHATPRPTRAAGRNRLPPARAPQLRARRPVSRHICYDDERTSRSAVARRHGQASERQEPCCIDQLPGRRGRVRRRRGLRRGPTSSSAASSSTSRRRASTRATAPASCPRSAWPRDPCARRWIEQTARIAQGGSGSSAW